MRGLEAETPEMSVNDFSQVPGKRIASRRPQPRSLRGLLSLCVVTVLVLVGFSPATGTARAQEDTGAPNSGAPGPVPIPIGSSSSSAPPWNGSTDSPGGPSPPPGQVRSATSPMRPIVSTAPPAVVPPRLENLTGEYRYSTVAGVYSFPKATPYLMQYKSREGETLVNASTFIAPVE